MCLFFTLVSMLLLTRCSNSIDSPKIREGDIVFIESQSSQSPYIKVGTMSRWTHCSIIVDTSLGLQELEASRVVKLTRYEEFVGKAKNGNFCVKSPSQGFI